jgi:predicted deacetylase
MKILMIYCEKFGYKPAVKNLDGVEEHTEEKVFENVQTAFIQVEEHDTENPKSTEKKLLNFIKWVARKNNCEDVILHSFAHLSESKADPEFTKQLFDNVETRLENAGYHTRQTPFGYFLDLEVKAPGFSMARVFKSF